MQFYKKKYMKRLLHSFRNVLIALTLCWCLFISLVGFVGNVGKAASSTTNNFSVIFSTRNFRSQLLAATSNESSNSGHITFTLQNGTPLWYGITVQTTPSGLTLTPANPSGDLISNTFFASTPLLPPAHVLPMDQWNGTYHFEALHLAAAFTDKGQQVQLQLTPTEPHAVTLDALTLIFQLLGQQSDGAQIGLLGPGILKDVFDTTSTMKDFNALVTNYEQVLQAVPDASATLTHAYACALNLTALFSDTSEQNTLADLLWKIQGKVIARADILKAITSITQTQFGLASEAFISNQSLAIGTALFQQAAPTIQLQSVDAATPTLTTTTAITPATSVTPITPVTSTPPIQTPRILPTATITHP